MWFISVAIAGTFTQAPVVSLEEAPGGAVTHRLRAGTAVEVLATELGRAQVRLVGRPDEHPITGWVRSSLLGDAPPAVPAPDDRGPTYVARCLDGRAELLGAVSERGWRTLAGAPTEALEVLAPALAIAPWTAVDAEHPLPGTPFPAPFTTVITNESPRSAYVPGDTELGDVNHRKLVLGPCEAEGLLMTRPVTSIAARPAQDAQQALADAIAHTRVPVRGGAVRRPAADPDWTELRVDVAVRERSCGGETDQWVDTSLVRLVHPTRPAVDLGQVDGAPIWVELDGVGLGVYPFETLLEVGQTVVWLGDAEPMHLVVLAEFGC